MSHVVNGSHCGADPLLVHCTSFYGGRTLGARHSCGVRPAQCGDVLRKDELLLASDGILLAAACLGYRVGQAPVYLHRSRDCGCAGSGWDPGIGLAGLAAS